MRLEVAIGLQYRCFNATEALRSVENLLMEVLGEARLIIFRDEVSVITEGLRSVGWQTFNSGGAAMNKAW